MRMPGAAQPKSVSDIARELWELAQAYAKQETVDPLKNLGRYLGFRIAGSMLLALGGGLLSLGLLRLLQTVDTFDGFWSFAPYLIVVAALAVVIGLMGRSIAASMSQRPGGERSATGRPTASPIHRRINRLPALPADPARPSGPSHTGRGPGQRPGGPGERENGALRQP